MTNANEQKLLEIFIPPELAPFEPDLRMFFDMMVLKLRINSHKGFADNVHPLDMLNHLHGEHDELRDSMLRGTQETTLAEAADVANFAWLCALSVLRMTKAEFVSMQGFAPAQETSDENKHP